MEPRDSKIAFYSCVTGEKIEPSCLNREYWARHPRMPVRFESSIKSAAKVSRCNEMKLSINKKGGCNYFVEISPHPNLEMFVSSSTQDIGIKSFVVPSLIKYNFFLFHPPTFFSSGKKKRWIHFSVTLPNYGHLGLL